MTLVSALYRGEVRHRRFAEASHDFRYPLCLFYLDIDELPLLENLTPLWSHRRFAPLEFRRNDYLPRHDGSLRSAVLAELALQGVATDTIGAIRLLSHLRCWGLCFNPVSFFYCFAQDNSTLLYVLAEVHNTPWNERHCYLVPADAERHHQHAFDKAFHVSPFLPMQMRYHWVFDTPGERIGVHMENRIGESRHFDATLSLQREPLDRAAVHRMLCRFPWMTFTVLTGIYWQALRLWWKGVRFKPHPNSST